MKNKHLVLLFLSVLVLGLLRFVPVHYRSFFHNDLIHVDTAAITQCVIWTPGRSEISLERTETGWAADQEGRVAAVEERDIEPLLATLAGLPVIRKIKTDRPDTLGLSDSKKIRVRVFNDSRLLEYFEVGNEIRESGEAMTYLQLPMHQGVYLVPGYLRRLFSRGLDDYRSRVLLPLAPESVRRIGISSGAQDSLVIFEKNDSLQRWISADPSFSLPNDSIKAWLALFSRLSDGPYADYFDESQAAEALVSAFRFETGDGANVTVEFYALKPPQLPEDIQSLRRRFGNRLPLYAVHSSENPMNYFAVMDTNLAHYLCFGLWPLPQTDKNEINHEQ